MCEKFVLIHPEIEYEMIDYNLPKKMYEEFKKLVKESALENIDKRLVFWNSESYETGERFDWIIATHGDRHNAFDKLIKNHNLIEV